MTRTERQAHAALVIQAAIGRWHGLNELTGHANAPRRQSVMMALTGETRPQAKCGVRALEALAFELFDIPAGHCPAMRRDMLADSIYMIANGWTPA